MSKIPTTPASKREVRSIRASELRATKNEDGTRSISGFIPYNSPSVDLGGFVEIIAPGAFRDALQPEADVLSLYSHDMLSLLGRTTSGTLTLTDSDAGLRYSVKLPNTTVANDLVELVDRGDISATSFGFNALDADWNYNADPMVRTLNHVALYEVSPVASPAYEGSAIALRNAPKEVRTKLAAKLETRDADDDECECDCAECEAGDCAECSNDDCTDPNCGCDQGDDERSLMSMSLELRKRKR